MRKWYDALAPASAPIADVPDPRRNVRANRASDSDIHTHLDAQQHQG